MIATQPRSRVAAHFETPEPVLPKSARERGKLWSDAVFQAVLAMKKLLRSNDTNVVMMAANALLELERTRMRHTKELAGSESVSEAQEQYEADQREEDADREARYAAAKAKEANQKEPTSPEGKAIAEHARHTQATFAKAGLPIELDEATEITEGMLTRMGLKAEKVTKAEFAELLKELCDTIEKQNSVGRHRKSA